MRIEIKIDTSNNYEVQLPLIVRSINCI